MSDLTKEHFDEAFKKIVTKDDLSSELSPIRERLTTIEKILDSQTVTLDGIAKQLLLLTQEKTATDEHLKHLDRFVSVVADRLNLDLKAIFN